MNDYKALRTFLLAAEKRNFAQVARELDMTPAAVTRAIAALEAELGVQLFVRTTRQVSLTTDGAIFAAQIQPAVKTLEDARREVMNSHKADEGRLRISAPTWFGKTVLPPILSGFKQRYPKMSFEISLSDGLVNIVDDDYDLAIRISSQPSDKFTIWRKIRVVPRILVAAPGSRFSHMQHPNELKPDDCLAYSGESDVRTGCCRTVGQALRFPQVEPSAQTAERFWRTWPPTVPVSRCFQDSTSPITSAAVASSTSSRDGRRRTCG